MNSSQVTEIQTRANKKYLLAFLPFLETVDGEKAETIIGYPNPNRGYGYGKWYEYYDDLEQARERMEFLWSVQIVEIIELRHFTPTDGNHARLSDRLLEERIMA